MGTSNLYAYEVQDSVWDGLGQGEDHTVPYRAIEAGNLYSGQSESCKKPWDGGIVVTSSPHKAGTRKDTSLEKNSWSCTLDGGLHPPCIDNTSKEVLSLQSNDTVMGNSACAAVGDNIYDCLPSYIPQADSQFDLFNKENGGKQSSDLLCYGWPDIGNFEEVDQMFRNCDSTFGLAGLQNEDEWCSFPSSQANEEPCNEMKSGFHVSNSGSSEQKCGICEGQGASRPENAGSSICCSGKTNSTMSFSTVCQTNKIEADPNEKSNLHKRRKYGNKSGGEDGYFEDGGYLSHGYSPDSFVDLGHLSGNSSYLTYSPLGTEQYKQNGESLPFACKQEDAGHEHSSFCHHLADQVSAFPTISSGLSGNCGQPSPSTKESSYSSNQSPFVDSGQRFSFSSPRLKNPYTEKLYCQEDLHASLSGNYNHANIAKATTHYNQDCNQKQPYQFDDEIEGQSGVEGTSTGIIREIDATNTQNSSITSSAPDETSVEAKSFHQLQQVMEKLDIRTKLCIRDGLYRLARSAEKRHGCENLDGSIRHDMEVKRALAAEQTNKCTGLMDMETNTNPIDRSIAHLLFHGPSDPSNIAGCSDAHTFKSPPLVHVNSAIIAEKQVPLGETFSHAEKKFVDELLD